MPRRRRVSVELDAARRRPAGGPGRAPRASTSATRHRLERERQPAGLDAGDVEHLVDQVEQVPAALEDLADALAAGRAVSRSISSSWAKPRIGVERRAQLVAHAREELALGPVGAARPRPSARRSAFRLHPRGDVAQEGGAASLIATAELGDGGLSGEFAAVLALAEDLAALSHAP